MQLNLNVNGSSLHRARNGRWFLGVCKGIANQMGWNPSLVRLGTVFLAIVIPGFSLLPCAIAYVILGIMLPEEA